MSLWGILSKNLHVHEHRMRCFQTFGWIKFNYKNSAVSQQVPVHTASVNIVLCTHRLFKESLDCRTHADRSKLHMVSRK